MSDEMKKLLEESLKFLVNTLRDGVNAASSQIPLIIQEKLRYDFFYYLYFSLAYTLLLTIALVVFFIVLKIWWSDENWDSYDSKTEGFLVISGVTLVLSTILWVLALGNNIPPMIQIHVAPRLYILEWLKEFVK